MTMPSPAAVTYIERLLAEHAPIIEAVQRCAAVTGVVFGARGAAQHLGADDPEAVALAIRDTWARYVAEELGGLSPATLDLDELAELADWIAGGGQS